MGSEQRPCCHGTVGAERGPLNSREGRYCLPPRSRLSRVPRRQARLRRRIRQDIMPFGKTSLRSMVPDWQWDVGPSQQVWQKSRHVTIVMHHSEWCHEDPNHRFRFLQIYPKLNPVQVYSYCLKSCGDRHSHALRCCQPPWSQLSQGSGVPLRRQRTHP